MDISDWLRELGLERYEAVFRDNEIDGEVLSDLTDADLKDLGLPLGPRKKLLKAIAALQAAPLQGGIRPVKPDPLPALPRDAERRQLTVMFVDLVGSTELSARLDPEDMRDVIRAYQDVCAGVITRFEGHVAKYMGDGVLGYFGYPQAHEDDAERAVRSGLELVQTVGGIRAGGQPLAARVGIATGVVVVGDLIGQGGSQEETVVGETPNLASRLQGMAEPGTVVIAASTRRLVGGFFELEDLGAQRLKGFAEPGRAWRVIGEGRLEGRFEALRGRQITPLVGREHEVAILLERWSWAKQGDGQVVLLSGEPGLGKSRLVRALRDRLADEPYTPISHFCSPYHINSALYPVIGLLERAAGFKARDTVEERLGKLEALLALSEDRVLEAVPLIAALLSIPTGDRYPRLDLDPQRQKQRTLHVLVNQLEGLAAGRPVLAVYEDVHWVDPTTLDLLDLVVERVRRLPVLVLISFRPEFSAPWTGQAHVTQLPLNRLGRRQGAAIVERLSGGKALPNEVLDQIVLKADGVPLFVEELTKTVLQSGLLTDAGGRYVLSGLLPPMAIPATLHDSLMARLDRLAPVKEVAQTAAVIGREFSHELLAVIADRPEEQLQTALDQLVESELIFRRGNPPAATYSFKHALVQEAAYQSLLKSRRQQIHARIAQALERDFPTVSHQQAELLAHHSIEAGLWSAAASYLLRAGKQAAERSAAHEAVAHLQRGLELVPSLPAGAARDRTELDFLLLLGPVLINTRTPGAAEVGRAYDRASQLAAAISDRPTEFAATWGVWFHNLCSGNYPAAVSLVDRLLDIGGRVEGTAESLQAHHCAWTTALNFPDLQSCIEHADRGSDLYDVEAHQSLKFLYSGHDPGVCAHVSAAVALGQVGRIERALERLSVGLALARELSHPTSLVEALCFAAMLEHDLGRQDRIAELAEEAIGVAQEHPVAPQFVATLDVIHGSTLAASGQAEFGLVKARSALDALRGMGATIRYPYCGTIVAETELLAGRVDEALATLDDAVEVMERTGERRWQSGTLHLEGRLFLARSTNNVEPAAVCFRRAIEVAQRQGARWLELRAASSLARLRAEQGRRREARDLLAPIYSWFTEGFDTADLIEAKQVLDDLG